MSNLNEQNNYGRQIRQESTHKDANGHTHTTRTTETVSQPSHNSYQTGYVNGQVSRLQENNLIERDNDNAARGLLLGVLLTVAALGGGAIWFFNQRNESPAPVAPIVVPVPNNKPESKPSPQASKAPEKTTIIEKTKEVFVPVPQPASPSPAARQNVNITVPSPASPSPVAPTQPQNPTSSNTSTSTPTESTQGVADTPEGTADKTNETGSSSSSDSKGTANQTDETSSTSSDSTK